MRGIKTALHRNQQPNNRRKSNCRKHQRAACKPNRKRCYQSNGQYSVTALTDWTGSISERYAYDVYGQPTVLDGGGTMIGGSAYGNRYTYTGREWDEELGLYHYRARMYDPVAGRFCPRDPIGFKGRSISLYQYVNSRPLTMVDPLGLYQGPIVPGQPWPVGSNPPSDSPGVVPPSQPTLGSVCAQVSNSGSCTRCTFSKCVADMETIRNIIVGTHVDPYDWEYIKKQWTRDECDRWVMEASV